MVHSILDLPADHSVGRGEGAGKEWQGWGCGCFSPSQCHSSCLAAPSFSPDIFSSVNVPPSLKVCLDLSAEYLILSDVQRKVGCRGAPWAELVSSGRAGCVAHP